MIRNVTSGTIQQISMTEDVNGFEIKTAHDGVSALPYGEYVWLLRRRDDKLYGVWKTRHDAIGAAVTFGRSDTRAKTVKEEWLSPVRVPVGSVRLRDVTYV